MEIRSKNKTKKFVDQRGKEYLATKILGEGGQGVVWELEGGKYAAKVVRAKDRLAAGRLEQRFKTIRGMDLADLPVAKPLVLLQRPALGYVMEIATGMVPLKSLLDCSANKSPVEWYISTGGIRRRLAILIRLAEVLAILHSRGIIYGDLSPANVFISEDLAYSEVFLIDLDNLRILTNGDEYIFTPGYGAPELLKQTAGISSLSDCHSFAVIAFQLLCLAHPLIGDYVNEGEPELEEQALCGEIPWVGHTSDSINSLSAGLPMRVACSPKLIQLFTQAFENGLSDSQERPSMSAWREALETANDALLTCPGCGGSYFFDKVETECRFCDEKQPDVFWALIKNWEPLAAFHSDGKEEERQMNLFRSKAQTLGGTIIGGKFPMTILKRHINLSRGTDGRKPLLFVSCDHKSATIEACENDFWLSHDLKKPSKKFSTKTVIPVEQLHGLSVHFEPLTTSQRIIHIRKLT